MKCIDAFKGIRRWLGTGLTLRFAVMRVACGRFAAWVLALRTADCSRLARGSAQRLLSLLWLLARRSEAGPVLLAPAWALWSGSLLDFLQRPQQEPRAPKPKTPRSTNTCRPGTRGCSKSSRLQMLARQRLRSVFLRCSRSWRTGGRRRLNSRACLVSRMRRMAERIAGVMFLAAPRDAVRPAVLGAIKVARLFVVWAVTIWRHRRPMQLQRFRVLAAARLPRARFTALGMGPYSEAAIP